LAHPPGERVAKFWNTIPDAYDGVVIEIASTTSLKNLFKLYQLTRWCDLTIGVHGWRK
jgi:hypothetical protein